MTPSVTIAATTVFTDLTVLASAPSRGRFDYYSVRCICGIVKEVRGTDLLRTDGRALKACSTGCYQRRQSHGGRLSPTYHTWRAMRKRCNDPKSVSWKNYGGRGIKVCDRWNDSKTGYVAFVEDMGERPHGMTLDRVNVNGGYEKANCKWATWAEQCVNKRGSVLPESVVERMREEAYWDEMEAEYNRTVSSTT